MQMENRKWSSGVDDGQLARRLMNDWNPRLGKSVFKKEDNGGGSWTIWYNQEAEAAKKTIVLDAGRFSDMPSFYKEIDRLFRNNPNREISYNLSTLNDLLRGGSRVVKFREPVKLVWKNSRKSMNDLGLKARNTWAVSESFFDILVDIISQHSHIELSLE